MNGQFDSPAWLSTLLMFALVGAGVMQTSPRNAGRPPPVEQIPHIPLYAQRISARLWEDPLEVARRAEKNRDATVDEENNRKWSTAPAAFLEQTELDYQTRKLTALALREAFRAHTPEHGRHDLADGDSRDLINEFLASAKCPEGTVERLRKALAWRALFQLRKKETNSRSSQRAKLQQIFAQALAIQEDVPAEARSLTSAEAREESNSRLISSLTTTIENRVIREARVAANNQGQDDLSTFFLQIAVSLDDAQTAPPFAERLHNALIRGMLSRLVAQEAGTLASNPTEPTFNEILTFPENKTLLLPIIVPAQMYPEIREQRLRMRYAVVSALAAANLNPENADELNLIPVPVYTKLGQKESGQVITLPDGWKGTDHLWVPVLYEIFRRPTEEPAARNRVGVSRAVPKSEYRQVVVFWMDTRLAKPSAFRKNITAILDTLCPASLRDAHLISTQGSEALTEILASGETSESDTKQALYFPFATVPKDWLRARMLERITNALPPVGQEPIVRMKPVKRVQASDDYVIEMLLNELSLRLPSFGRKDGDVCLFYETDSFYGRSMVDVFTRRYREFTDRPDAKVESIPYLKGVDGTLPTVPEQLRMEVNPQDTTALLKAFNKRVMEGTSGQWVLDQRQTDYLERWASNLQSTQPKPNIRAIGVFGTNVFDKIKVIEILRKEFRNVWFFTVDLDASLINNDNPLATRNVLIGSAMGLSVHTNDLKSPQFRDSFQSAVFLSTLDALGLLGKDYKGEPGVWETSRIGFEPLAFNRKPKWHIDFMDEERPSGSGPVKGEAWNWSTFLENHFQAADGRKFAQVLRPLLLILTTVVLLAVAKVVVEAWKSPNKPAWHKEAASRLHRILPPGSYKRILSGMFAAIAALCLFGFLAEKVLGGFSEPFHWFDGVSVWPSLLIRAFAAALGFYFFMRSFVDIDSAIQNMWASGENGLLLKGLNEARFSRTSSESRYYCRLLSFVVAFVIFQWALIHLLSLAGGYFTPARGVAAFVAHEITFLFSMAAFYLLIWSAVLRHLHCKELLNTLDALTTADRVEGRKRMALPKGALSKPELDALFAYNQTVVQSILYPFAMLVVLLASRHPVFDAWNFPQSLLVSNALILGILVFCAYLLNQAANQFAAHQQSFLRGMSKHPGSSHEPAAWDKEELRGSFVPFWKQPVIQALSLAMAGVGLQWIQ
jgi:hypothetical protein